MSDLHKHIAAALGPKWTECDVKSFSLLSIRELLRENHQDLYDEVTALVESGQHIYGE